MGQPQVCELGSEKGFLCLDCETFITSKKRSREASDGHLPGLFIKYLSLFCNNSSFLFMYIIYENFYTKLLIILIW